MELYTETVCYMKVTQDELDNLNMGNGTRYDDGDFIYESFNVYDLANQTICDAADALYIIIKD